VVDQLGAHHKEENSVIALSQVSRSANHQPPNSSNPVIHSMNVINSPIIITNGSTKPALTTNVPLILIDLELITKKDIMVNTYLEDQIVQIHLLITTKTEQIVTWINHGVNLVIMVSNSMVTSRLSLHSNAFTQIVQESQVAILLKVTPILDQQIT